MYKYIFISGYLIEMLISTEREYPVDVVNYSKIFIYTEFDGIIFIYSRKIKVIKVAG